MNYIKQLLCTHIWATMLHSYNYYDEEVWEECVKCNKQKELI